MERQWCEFLPAGNDGRFVVYKGHRGSGGLIIWTESLYRHGAISIDYYTRRPSFNVPNLELCRVLYEKADFSTLERRRRKDPHWQVLDRRVYIACIFCGSINDITNHSIGVAGIVSNCAVCQQCGVHVYLSLAGFTHEDYNEIRYGTATIREGR